MNRRILFLLFVFLLFIFAVVVKLFQENIASALWHERHGDSIDLAEYRIPVPRLWFVDGDTGTLGQLGRAHVPSLGRVTFQSQVTASVLPKPVPDLGFWERQEHALYEREGAVIQRRREIQLGPQLRIVCLEGNLVREVLKAKIPDLVSANCQSDKRLNLMFTGMEDDLPEFYAAVGGIHVVN